MVERLLVANIIEEGRWGGPQNRIAQVAEGLENFDIETVVFLPIANSERFRDELAKRQVSHEMLDLTVLSKTVGALFRYVATFLPDIFRLTRLLKARPYDVAHVSGGAWQIKGAIAGRLAGVPVIWHLNDSHMPAVVVWLLRVLGARLARAFFVSSERTRAYYLNTPALRDIPAFLVPAPVDTRRFDPQSSTPAERVARLPGLKIVTVANINAVKGLDVFIRAAKAMVDAGHTNCSFVIAGAIYQTQASYNESLQALLHSLGLDDKVHFLGAAQDVQAILAAADIYVCSSRAESSPVSVWEAMSMARPIVSTDVGDVALFVSAEESGLIVPVGDFEAMAVALGRLARDPSLRARLGARARTVATGKLDIRVVAAITAESYRTTVRKTNQDRGRVLGVDASNLRSGGGVTHLVEMLRVANPQAYGFDRVVVWAASGLLNKIEERPWMIKAHHPLLDGGLARRSLWRRIKLKRAAHKQDCSVLFVPGGADLSGFRPMVTMSRNLLPFEWSEARRYGVSWTFAKNVALHFVQKRSLRKADGVIFLTKYAKETVERWTGNLRESSPIVPHGVSLSFVRPPRVQEPLSSYSLERPFKLVYVSMVDVYKHQWNVAQAVADLKAAGLPLMVDFVGPNYPPALERLNSRIDQLDPSRSFIRYLGPVPHAAMGEVYASAHMGVFASSCENMPNVLIEAMASGLPIACSSKGPMPEVLGEGGTYFDPENPKDIADAIRALIDDPELRLRSATIAFERAKQYSWGRCANETFGFLASTVNAARESVPNRGLAQR